MKRKQFSKKLHKEHDPKTRTIIKKFFLEAMHIPLLDNENIHGVDLLSPDKKLKVEGEHRDKWWKCGIIPFSTVHMWERKTELLMPGDVHFAMLSIDYSTIGIIPGYKIVKYLTPKYLKENSNLYEPEDEFSYHIPRNEFKFWDVNTHKQII
jgi:hypothetical protein